MRKVPFAALVLGLLSTSVAHADDVQGTRFELAELRHDVTLEVGRGSARLVVRRTVQNPGPKSDQAVFWINVPESAVATRLRTAGLDHGKPVWFEGELLDAEVAAHRYEELTGLGGYYPKDPALLSWRHRGELALQVFPVTAKTEKTVEYTLEMPLAYRDGAYRLSLPTLGTEALPATLHVRAQGASDALRVNGLDVAPGTTQTVRTTTDPEGTREVEIELVPRVAESLAMRVADVRIDTAKRLLHASFEAAPKLGVVPQHAAIAVVLDTSRSMQRDLGASLAAIRAYLGHFSSGQVTFVTFDRKVHVSAPRSVADTVAALQAFGPTLGNGSALDDALVAADRALAAAPGSAKRMLVVTDLKPRAALTPGGFAKLPITSNAIVHVASIGEGPADLLRDDDAEWATLPRRTGGVLWYGHAAVADADAKRVFEELARPVRIDHLKIDGLAEYAGDEEMLAEGQGIEHLTLASAQSTVTVTGQLWSRPYHGTARSDAEEERRWSALVFGTYLADELSEPEQLLLALKGRAVSPMTSYLAIEPGVRPSTEGLEEHEMGLGSGGGGRGEGIGLSGIGTIGHGTGFDAAGFLRAELSAAWRRCGGRGKTTVVLETTGIEIVDVTKSPTSCLHEATWSLQLPAAFDTVGSDTFAVDVES